MSLTHETRPENVNEFTAALYNLRFELYIPTSTVLISEALIKVTISIIY